MLSGSNYLVSVIEVLQSEKKLKLKGLLKLYSASKGIIRIKDFSWNSVTQYQRVIMTRNLWLTFLMNM